MYITDSRSNDIKRRRTVNYSEESNFTISEDEENPMMYIEPNSVMPVIDEVPESLHNKRIQIITPNVAAALDRCKVTDRNAAYLLSACASALCPDIDVDALTVSYSTIRRQRQQVRSQCASSIKMNFVPGDWLVVHWDGKLMEKSKTERVDKLSVTVTGMNDDQLLSVVPINRSTGDAQAAAVHMELKRWQLENSIVGLCFDTTRSNTGIRNGACAILEQLLGRELLYLACRHHVLELVLRSVFEESVKIPLSGPNVGIFKRFQQSWETFDHLHYESGIDHPRVRDALEKEKQTVINFCFEQLKEKQPRDDYAEFLELVILFLGETPPCGLKFRKPGAVHHARWMAKALYSLKIFMFKTHFDLNAQETSGLCDVCIFICKEYIKAWFTAPVAISAPNNDLQFLKSLHRYSSVNKQVADAAINKFTNHLWYLSDELVALAFFDEDVPDHTKLEMVQALEREPIALSKPPAAKINDNWAEKKLSDFVSSRTYNFFDRFGISVNFLKRNPALWTSNQYYLRGQEMLKHLKVINDVAERGVALAQTYNGILTRCNDGEQNILQLVSEHRRKIKNCNKSNLKLNFKSSVSI